MKNMDDKIQNYLLIMAVVIFSLIIMLLCYVFYLRKQNKQQREKTQEWKNEKSNLLELIRHVDQNIHEVNNSLNRDLLRFSNELNQQFVNFYDRSNQRFEQIEQQIHLRLSQQKDFTFNQNKEVLNRMGYLDQAQTQLRDLSKQMLSLQSILQDKKSRGIYGEVELYSLLEASIGSQQYMRQAKLSSGVIVDALLPGFSGMNPLAIDAKFPLENYRKMNDVHLSDSEKNEFRKQFSRDVKKHIQDIAEKYLLPSETAPMAFMFIPAEAIYAEIYANFSEIVDYSYHKKVYLCSPTTLMAYITAVRSIYLQQHRDSHASELVKQLQIIYEEVEKWLQRQQKTKRDFERFCQNYQEEERGMAALLNEFQYLYEGKKKSTEEP